MLNNESVRFKCKTDEIWERVAYMHPMAVMIMAQMALYCLDNELPFLITDSMTTLAEDMAIQRRHSTHRTGRAFDLSIKNWSELDIQDFRSEFNHRFETVAAVSSETLEPDLVVYKNHGTGPHLHIQIHARFSNNKLKSVEGGISQK